VRAPRSDLTALSIEWKLPLMAAGVLLAVAAALCSAAYLQVSRSVEGAAS